MEQWDPMKEDFDNKQFNSYSQGVGRDLAGRGQKIGVCLNVQNIPPTLGKVGFYNLFAEYGKVLHHNFIISDSDETRKAYGYVTMDNMLDAETAIRKLNSKKIGSYTLRVTPALSPEEKLRRRKLKQAEERFLSNRDSDDRSVFHDQEQTKWAESAASSSSSGYDISSRGLSQSWTTKSHGFNSKVTERGDGNYDQQINMFSNIHMVKGDCQSKEWPKYNDTHTPSREVFGPDSYSRNDFNDKNSTYNEDIFPNSDGKAMGKNLKIDSDGNSYGNKIKANKNYSESKFGSTSKIISSSQNNSHLQNNSSGLGKNSFNTHKPESLRGQDARTHLSASLYQDDFCFQNQSYSLLETPLENSESGSFKHQQHRTALSARTTQAAQKGNKTWKDKNDLKEGNNMARQIGTLTYHEKAAKPKGLNIESNFRNNRPKNDWPKRTEESARRKPDNLNREDSSNSHNQQSWAVNEKDNGDTMATRTASKLKELSVHVKTSGLCYLTHFESPYKFWISFDEFLEIFTDCTSLMRQEIPVTPPTSKIAYQVGGTYGVLYMGDWCRVTILSIQDREATIFYCDYGNQGTVKLQDLRPLTQEMLELPAQAICCTVSKLKPVGSESWTEAASTAVTKWLGEPITKFLQYEVVDKEGSIHAVEIFLDGMALSEVLISGGFAEHVKYEPGLPSSVKNFKSEDQEPPRYMACTLPSKMDEIKNGDEIYVVVFTDFILTLNFMALDVTSEALLNDLASLLLTEYSSSTVPYRPIQGELVAAKFSADGLWYRAEVVSIDGDACVLLFVDYGNSEVQTIENIRPITNQKLIDVPKQALFCSLHATKSVSQYGQDCVDIINKEFHTLLVSAVSDEEHTLLLVEEKTKDFLLVDVLTKSGLSLSAALTQKISELSSNMQQKGAANIMDDEQSALITQTLSSSSSPTKKPSLSMISELGTDSVNEDNTNFKKSGFQQETQKSAFQQEAFHAKHTADIKHPATASDIIMEALPTTGEPVQVMVTHIDSCSRLFISRKDKNLQDEISQIMYQLNSTGASLPQLKNVVADSVCAAQYSQDKHWYRAQVVDICNSTTCIVHFVDYGNSEETLISNLRILKPAMMKLPSQAIGCCLKGYESGLNSDISPQSMVSNNSKLIDRLKTELVERSFTARVVDRKLDTYIIDLENELGECIGKNFQLSDLIFKTPVEKVFEAIICHINNLNDFYCQRFDAQELEELQSMSAALKDDILKLGGNVHIKPVVNGVYASQYEGTWYRCVVEEVRGPNVFIRYIDYGNCEEAPAIMLQPLNPDRLSLPVRLLKCKIYGVTPVHENWNSPEMREYLKLLQQYPVHIEIEGKEKDTFLASLTIKHGSEKISVAADLVETGMAKFCQIVSPQKEETNAMQSSPHQPIWLPQNKKDDEEDDVDDLEIQRQIEELQIQLNLSKQKKNKK